MEAPEYYQGTYCSSQFLPEKLNAGDHFAVEDLLDFSNEDAIINDSIFEDVAGDSTESSSLATVVDSCNSSSFSPSGDLGYGRNLSDGHFSGDLCVPYDDLAELEWLSNFVEESFSNDDHMHKLHMISGMRIRPEVSPEFMNGNSTTSDTIDTTDTTDNDRMFDPDMLIPAKARSKRNRTPPCDWTSRLQVLSPATWSSSSSSTESDVIASPPPNSAGKSIKICPPRKKESGDLSNGEGRRCLHCATDKTPQWRTGPMGPKTLCNACGVRFKSGRLVPEYRPAASPTFMLTKHSNSHRKVLELRRQKEMMKSNHHHQHHHQQQQFFHHHQHHHLHHQEQNQNMVFDVLNDDDYLIHQHIGPDFRQLI